MFKSWLLLFLIAFGVPRAEAQVRVSGHVYDGTTNEPLPFANVILINAKDSSFYKGTATDLKGGFLFDDVLIGRYTIMVSCLGYEEFKETVRIALPSSGNIWTKEIRIKPSETTLQEVTVKGSRIAQQADHRIITFTDEQRRNAQYAKDLLKTLPELRENPLSGKIESLQGSEPLILINGVKATETELHIIPPGKVKRVEYYDIPPARYATVGGVINIITSRLDNGLALGVQSLTAVTTGFSDDIAYLSSTRGDHRFDISYQMNFRNYKHRNTDIAYEYIFDNLMYVDATKGTEKFGYTDHDLTLKYAYLKYEKQLFQVTLSPTFHRTFSDGVHQGVYAIGDFSEKRKRILNDKNNTVNPAVDLYYWRKNKSGDELAFNLHSTYFHTKGETGRHEFSVLTQKEYFSDEMILNNRKSSIIGEAIYSKGLYTSKLNVGYKIEYAHLNSGISNLYGKSDYTSDYVQQYTYGELVGVRRKFVYRASVGLTYLYNQSYSNSYHQLLFTPKVIVGYNFNSFNSLRLGVNRSPVVPNINQLSNNAVVLTPDIISKGNPDLDSGSSTGLVLMGSHNSRYFNISAGFAYAYIHHPIEQYFQKEHNKIYLTYRNGKFAHHIGGKMSFLYKPFGTEIFTINTFVAPTWQKVYTEEGVQKNLSVENFIVASFAYKGWNVNYQYSIPTYSVSGAFRMLSENANNLMVSYKHRQWRFTAGALFIGQDSHYRTESLGNAVVFYINDRKIHDNKTMLVFGVEYNFNSGKNKQVDRKISNSDNVAPTY